MNRLLALIAVGITLAAAAPKPKVLPPPVGAEAPDFTLLDQSGKMTRLSAARGRKTLLVFYRGYW